MKNYKIQLEDSEVQFFKQLMDRLGYVKYEEIEEMRTVNEPRIYPATNFSIHGKNNQPERKIDNSSEEKTGQITNQSKQNRKDAMTDIKDIMSKIEQMRNRAK